MKIKIYSGTNESEVSQLVNGFVNDHPDLNFKDFKLSTSCTEDYFCYTVMIIYDEVKK